MLKKYKKPVSDDGVAGLLNRLDFSPENVVDEAAHNPRLFIRACDYRIVCMRVRSKAKMNMKRVAAEIEMEIRAETAKNGDKLTENNIKATLILEPKVIEAETSFEEAEINEEYSKLLVEAFRMRRDCLQIVKGMVSTEQSLTRAAESQSEVMETLREKLHTKLNHR